ncbi:MAG: hypothetical protein HY049_16900 [Acidobacteria bacterium]|nr:hypothetical protein [Acidobacteriota bacterium]
MTGTGRAARWLPALAGAIAFVALAFTAASTKSATYDEGVHLLAGYRILTASDCEFNHEHPPLMKALAALPVVITGAAAPLDPWTYRRESDEWALSHNWLYHANDGDRLLRLGRLPIAIAGGLLAALVAATALSVAGPLGAAAATGAAGAAALLFAMEPNLLAHGALVTTDMGMTLLFFAATIAFERCLRSNGTAARAWAGGAGAIFGLGLLAKFTAILLGPCFAAMGAASIGLARARRGAWRELGIALAIAAGVALLVLNAGYAFHGSFSSLRSMKLESDSMRERAKGPLGAIPLPAPASWISGYDHAEAGGQRWWSYLMGMHSMTGWRGYYLVALLVKTSIPLLALALSGVVFAARGAPETRRRAAILCISPVLLLAAFTVSGSLKNIGLRYVLPVYPFLCLLGALGAVALWRLKGRAGRVAAAVLLVWAVGAEARTYPDQLTYFNEIAGGPAGGRWWLLDSNLDWGQDLKGLGAWIRARGVSKIFVDYFGRACPRAYGVQSTKDFEGGLLAISATNLEGVYREERGRYDFLAGVAPVATIGHSILVYDVPRPEGWRPLPGGALE